MLYENTLKKVNIFCVLQDNYNFSIIGFSGFLPSHAANVFLDVWQITVIDYRNPHQCQFLYSGLVQFTVQCPFPPNLYHIIYPL